MAYLDGTGEELPCSSHPHKQQTVLAHLESDPNLSHGKDVSPA